MKAMVWLARTSWHSNQWFATEALARADLAPHQDLLMAWLDAQRHCIRGAGGCVKVRSPHSARL